MEKTYRLGVDIGSTTVKIAILDEENELCYSEYKRHFANIQETLAELIKNANEKLGNISLCPMITGSGGLQLSKHLNIEFIQEVIAVATSTKHYAPTTDVAIELGGEDAKIIYFGNSIEQRMNGICAGGTGSFIDQMADLLQTDASGLNEYAKDYKTIYPIAARCGVFAKTDIQPLINEGATKEDLSASIFQAVVNQTISGLACGKPIRGNVAFIGGPLHFLSELRAAFIRTLNLTDESAIHPENSHLYAAIGAAMNATEKYKIESEKLYENLSNGIAMKPEIARLRPLFSDSDEYKEFTKRHESAVVPKKDLSTYHGECFLGIDAGSTTTKLALIDNEGNLLWSFYSNNNGSPIETAKKALRELMLLIPYETRITYSCSTGYGEALLKSALMLDEGEVETVAHYYAAKFFCPDVTCVLDIGGQDMKYMRIKNGAIDNVLLNEACSSGCGSFIENFATSMNYSISDFAHEALKAKNPVDLGTRCTVFMNSNVKQAQKEGASVSDISAGLSYSVIKNALYKVIKIVDASQMGDKIVVQGGTFYNDSILRAFELISGREVIRPDISGIMGAFGAALIARERYAYSNFPTSMLTFTDILNLEYTTSLTHCKGCENSCLLTINKFDNDRRFITGNRCEKPLGNADVNKNVPNLFKYKLQRIFDYESFPEYEAPNGVIGIPRVLNMYENFPFWAVFFKELGYSVKLSPLSSRAIYELGIETIPSESECYPAKLAHGHVQWLINNGITKIFYPSIAYERNETPDANNHYNCPMVMSYPENIKNNVEDIDAKLIDFIHPFLSMENFKIFSSGLVKVFTKEQFQFSADEILIAAKKGWQELEKAKKDIQDKGKETLKWIKENKAQGIVLAGRPYHIDPEINHGIPEIITSNGIAVLTEDSISDLGKIERPLIVSDQWMYHSRLYRAANFVKHKSNLNLVQLFSFGCGLDAVTTDQVNDILTNSGKLYTVIKIDEISNLGAARIRIRSLLCALEEMARVKKKRQIVSSAYKRVEFTKKMKDDGYTILAPQMAPIQFDLVKHAFNKCGYNFVILDNDNKAAVNTGLKYVNNDACYPSTIVVGQMIEALLSGEYDLDKTALLITQTGGGCRATNYIGFIRRALAKANMSHIPVISLSFGIEKNSGFKVPPSLIVNGMYALVIGDLFMKLIYATRPYEIEKGSTEKLYQQYKEKVIEEINGKGLNKKSTTALCKEIVEAFDSLPRSSEVKPKVGVVGEILVKFSPMANNKIIDLLEAEGAEGVMPDFLDFLYYCFYNGYFKVDNYNAGFKTAITSALLLRIMDYFRKPLVKALSNSTHYNGPADIKQLGEMASKYVSLGNQSGEGWFLTGEMLELINSGVKNIVCVQPFGCLPNHVVGKGVIKTLRTDHEDANIVAIDYDPGASEVNQLNRIKLMLSTAKANLPKPEEKEITLI